MGDTCATCVFFRPSARPHDMATGEGTCRRYPPPSHHALPVTTHADGWCGEHRPKALPPRATKG